MKKFEVNYSFTVRVDAENHQEAVDKANAEVRKNIEKYGPGTVDESWKVNPSKWVYDPQI